ncbi:hypothetical protein L226DRAFT_323235 [Lentinus tigrinus ALCF2SS1-7]|uniref:uncharacterized protein n=1 Tax=Lentinus tigrinus ALCF2SS1-7 TaxID=1328758 RepID=UPI001165F695|nr:hypothetical protein L226DRAFT_323235 [Lentinus tigrinus ALCF2SS1-7]
MKGKALDMRSLRPLGDEHPACLPYLAATSLALLRRGFATPRGLDQWMSVDAQVRHRDTYRDLTQPHPRNEGSQSVEVRSSDREGRPLRKRKRRGRHETAAVQRHAGTLGQRWSFLAFNFLTRARNQRR